MSASSGRNCLRTSVRTARAVWGVLAKHETGRGARCIRQQSRRGVRQAALGLPSVDLDTHWLGGVESLPDDGVRLVVVVKIEAVSPGCVAGCGERHNLRS